MHITRINAKAEPDPLVEGEFLRCFAAEPDEAVLWAFRDWRQKSPFWPAISDIRERVDSWKRERRQAKAERDQVRERQEDEKARAEGRFVDVNEVRAMVKQVAKQVAMERPRQTRSEDLRTQVLVEHTADEWDARRVEIRSRMDAWLAGRQVAGQSGDGA